MQQSAGAMHYESRLIYGKVVSELDVSIRVLAEPSGEDELDKAQRASMEVLSTHQEALREEVRELEASAEWDVFTVAFYGETNAGKSTLIEATRVLLEEPTKLESRRKFRELQAMFGLSGPGMVEAQASLVELARARDAARQHLEDLRAEQAAMPWWKRLLGLFAARAARTEVQGNLEALSTRHDEAERRCRTQEEQLVSLRQFADGQIIGDGRSDYTKHVQAYSVQLAGQPIALLDVPGIQGKEESVQTEITSALRKAHGVFFVVNQPAPPQVGTLETVRQHLGAQVEVGVIFNKKIQNPKPLSANGLINAGEREALAELDKVMAGCLGDGYRGSITLSAGPAFLAVGDCLEPGSEQAREREKFLSAMGGDAILEKSRMREFLQLVGTDLVRDCRKKIVASNLRKVQAALEDSIANASAQRDRLSALAVTMQRFAAEADTQARSSTKALRRRLRLRGESLIDTFSKNVVEELYGQIDKGIDSDDLKRKLENTIDKHRLELEDALPGSFQKEFARFTSEITDILERAREKMDDVLDHQLDFASRRGAFDLRMDDGLRPASLLGAAIGCVMLFVTQAGWVMLAISVVGLALSAYKGIRSRFDNDFKKGQQRAVVDRNARSVVREIREALTKHLDSTVQTLDSRVEETTARLSMPARRAAHLVKTMDGTIRRLGGLSHEIKRGKFA